jgi:glc operon protein GlcG
MDTIQCSRLSQAGARKVLDEALGHAEKMGLHVTVAVTDDAGHLLTFARMDGVELYTVAISQAKARGAAMTRFNTGKKSPTGNERTDHHALAITLAAGADSFVSIPGGAPIFKNAQLVGAIGVSGAGHADAEIARLCAESFQS